MGKDKGKRLNKQRQRREVLFNLYSQNWSIARTSTHLRNYYLPNVEDSIICPLCFTGFRRIALDLPDMLTLEHVPPAALGGRNSGTILLCKKCNNTAGTLLDSQLQKDLEFRDFDEIRAGSIVEGRFSFYENEWVPAIIKIDSQGVVDITGNLKRTNPKYAEKLTKAPSFPFKQMNVTFTVRTPNENLAEVNLLRIAYLMLFRIFGYGPLLHPNMLKVREQILNPQNTILPKPWQLHNYDFPDDFLGINVVDFPMEMRSFLVLFKLETKISTRKFAVFLPRLDETGLDIYGWLQNRDKQQVSFTHKVVLPKKEYLQNPYLAFFAYYYWQK